MSANVMVKKAQEELAGLSELPADAVIGLAKRKEDRSMSVNLIVKKALEGFAGLSELPVNAVIGLAKREEGWVVSLETVERKAIPETMDVLGLYEVRVDSEGALLSFERKKLRKRGETQEG